MNFTLRQLAIFEATARLGRLTMAAEEQAISQSAASQAVTELERQMGLALFERRGRELLLTPAGRDRLPQVRLILGDCQRLAEGSGDELAGQLRIAASTTIACYVIPGVLALLTDQYPGIRPAIDIQNTRGVLQQLETGQAQIGLIEGPAVHDYLQIRRWQEDRLALFVTQDHPLAKESQVSTEQLETLNWIVREPGSGTREVFDTAMQAVGLQPKIRLTLSRQEAIKQAVLSGLGAGCLSHLSLDADGSGRFVPLNTDLTLVRSFSWVCSPEALKSPLVQAFMKALN
ncbi:MAG: LysR family transcriptional regulator [Saccharospirillum sp.]|uniref:LysR family transcriptional regulator n=1 Tax=Saccharospirillum sp. TaxID=2033801 RepID=UPI0034A091F1